MLITTREHHLTKMKVLDGNATPSIFLRTFHYSDFIHGRRIADGIRKCRVKCEVVWMMQVVDIE